MSKLIDPIYTAWKNRIFMGWNGKKDGMQCAEDFNKMDFMHM